MLAKDGVIQDAYDVILVVLVLLLEEAQETQLDAGLVLEALLVSDHLDGHHQVVLVVKALKGLSEAARAQLVEHLKAIGEVVLDNDLVVSTLVIEAKVVTQERCGLNLRRIKPQEVDLRVVLNLDLFIVGHTLVLKQLEGLAAGHGELNFVDADSRGRLLWI